MAPKVSRFMNWRRPRLGTSLLDGSAGVRAMMLILKIVL
jgi:hypothetical protein